MLRFHAGDSDSIATHAFAAPRPLPRRRTSALIARAFLLGAVTAALFSCTGAAPRILEVESRLSLVDNRDLGVRYEQLSIFLRPQDEDGLEDIEYVYLINDRARLYWTLTSDQFERRKPGNDTWIGVSSVVMADYSPFPRGEYRLVLVDLAGERDERIVYVGEPVLDPSGVEFPSMTTSTAGGRATASVAPFAQPLIYTVYDAVGGFVASGDLKSGRIDLATLIGRGAQSTAGYRIYLSAERPDGVSVLAGPF